MGARPTQVLDDGRPPGRELWPWVVVLFVLALAGTAAVWIVTRAGGGTAAQTTTRLKPAPAATAAPVRTVTVKVTTSESPSLLPAVPSVVGADEKTAKRTLRDAGFASQVEHVQVSDPAGDKVVVGQQPVSGAHVPADTRVIISIGHRAHEGD